MVLSKVGIVKNISLGIQYTLPLKSVIDLLGAPDYIFYTPNSPHGGDCEVSLNWPQKRISVKMLILLLPTYVMILRLVKRLILAFRSLKYITRQGKSPHGIYVIN